MSEILLYGDPKSTIPSIIREVGGDLTQYDSNFWNDLNTSFSSATSLPITGYETFSIRYNAESVGTVTFTKYRFDDGQGNIRIKSSSPYYTGTYSNITIAGKPGEQIRVAAAFIPSLTAYTAADVPYITGIGDTGIVEVLERWPTTQMYASSYGDNDGDLYDSDRIVYSYEPAVVYFTDGSIARTFPISGWFIDYGDGVTSTSAVADPFYHPANSIVEHENMFIHTYDRANTYYATLYTEASTTATKSANVYRNYSAYDAANKTLNTAVTSRVDVYPTRQTNNFFVISGESVEYNYTATTPTPLVQVSSTNSFISGYSPNLTVMFQESCTPVSFPISGYQWTFGNVFNISGNVVDVSASHVQTGFGAGWITNETNHYISYTYIFPGLYSVSLGSEISSDPSYSPAFDLDLSVAPYTKHLLVYVEEILPQASFGMSSAVGGAFTNSITFDQSPMTVYFNASSTIAGSFPIGKVAWDFGDGTQETVLSSVSVPFPQNYIVNHEYTRTVSTQPSTFDVSLTAYAFNTESYGICSIYDIGILSVSAAVTTALDIPVHLLETNFFGDNDVLIVMEGRNKTTFNYLISTESLT